MTIEDELAQIMRAGVLAPSADNRHCFQFEPTPNAIGLFVADDYVSAPFHRRVLHRISLGAVVENMSIRAGRLGYCAEVQWLDEPSAPGLIVRLHLRPAPPRGGALDAAIEARHTNRRLRFAGPPLSRTELNGYSSLIADIPGVALTFFDEEPQRSALLRLIGLAESERFAIESMHDDLFSAVRFDVGWHASADEGLPPAVLEVEPGLRWGFAQLRHWRLMSVLARFGAHRVLGFRAAYLPARLAPHRGVLTSTAPWEQATVAAGRALQRIWLHAHGQGLALQPLAGAALLAFREYRDVRDATRTQLMRGWAKLTDQRPLMVFRLGRAAPSAVRTKRPPFERFLRR